MAEYITHSRAETVALGKRMAAVLQPGALIAFTGGLGAGKTAFTEGLAEGLGCTDPVSSPTFAIVNYYRGPRPLAHFDLYRISTENDLCAAGFYDYLDQGAVVAAEWSENFADLLALEDPIRVDIQRVDENTRRNIVCVCLNLIERVPNGKLDANAQRRQLAWHCSGSNFADFGHDCEIPHSCFGNAGVGQPVDGDCDRLADG